MNKKEYLDLLRYYLKNLPKTIVDDIISDYNEHFDIAIELGKSEEEISIELGSPKVIADQFLENENNIANINTFNNQESKNIVETKKETNIWIIIAAIVGIIFLSPLILGLLGAFIGIFAAIIGVFIALLASSIGILISGFVLLVYSIVPIGTPSYISVPAFFELLHPITKISGSVFLICLSFLLTFLSFKLIEAIFRLIKQLIQSINWKIKKGWNNNAK